MVCGRQWLAGPNSPPRCCYAERGFGGGEQGERSAVLRLQRNRRILAKRLPFRPRSDSSLRIRNPDSRQVDSPVGHAWSRRFQIGLAVGSSRDSCVALPKPLGRAASAGGDEQAHRDAESSFQFSPTSWLSVKILAQNNCSLRIRLACIHLRGPATRDDIHRR
jgi:hypothetical protein